MANFHFFDAGMADLSVTALFGEVAAVAHRILCVGGSAIEFEYEDTVAGTTSHYEHGETAIDRLYSGSRCALRFMMRESQLADKTDTTLAAIAQLSGNATISAVAEETAYSQGDPAGTSGTGRALPWTLTPHDNAVGTTVLNKTIIIPTGVARITGSPIKFMADSVENRGIAIEVIGLLTTEEINLRASLPLFT